MKCTKELKARTYTQISFRITNGEIEKIAKFFSTRPYTSYKDVFFTGLDIFEKREKPITPTYFPRA